MFISLCFYLLYPAFAFRAIENPFPKEKCIIMVGNLFIGFKNIQVTIRARNTFPSVQIDETGAPSPFAANQSFAV